MTEVNDSYRAAYLLSGMFYTDTGIEMTPSVIEAFINRRWDRLAPLAHRIHSGEDKDVTKPAAQPWGVNEDGSSVP